MSVLSGTTPLKIHIGCLSCDQQKQGCPKIFYWPVDNQIKIPDNRLPTQAPLHDHALSVQRLLHPVRNKRCHSPS